MSKFPSLFRRTQSTGSDLRSRSRFSRYSESSSHSTAGEVGRIDEEEDEGGALSDMPKSSSSSLPKVSIKIRLAHVFLRPQLKFRGRTPSLGTQFSASPPTSKPHSIPE
ncbi:hypothetical protein BASA81_006436 [Batrachochytrium salamandrivorans]|nr:hypothetical protein BASA81_006436 [Batrachochytrium salamandrivorans]